jgi:transcription-repair coupling factor (superfamily II helicase)
MTLYELYHLYAKHPIVKQSIEYAKQSKRMTVGGLQGSSLSLFLACAYEKLSSTIVYVSEDKDSAAYVYNDLVQMLGMDEVLFFPSAYSRMIGLGKANLSNEVLRTDTLGRLSSSRRVIVVTYPEALVEKVIAQKTLVEKSILIREGEEWDQELLIEQFVSMGFERVDFVYEPGQFSVRGSIVDVFSFSNELPYRIDFFGNEVDTIRLFDIETQLSESPCREAVLSPNVQELAMESNAISFFEFLSDNVCLAFGDLAFLRERIKQVYDATLVARMEENVDFSGMMINGENFLEEIEKFSQMRFVVGNKADFVFSTSPQPLYHKNFDLGVSSFKEFLSEGYQIYILSDSLKQTDRIKSIFEDKGVRISFSAVLKTLHSGFVDHDMKVCIFSDHEIFDRYHKYTLKSDRARNGKAILTLKELSQFQIGDYVTHIDHGVGQFGGLMKQVDANGKRQEVIKLIYKDGDVIFVSIHNLHRIAKYKGREGEPPKINKLGSGAWERLKERTKKKVKDIARDLIRLYALRKAEKGFAYSPDTYLQQELEASFVYEDTPDQLKATQDVKADMERSLPMDRLVCGDVGFGKTEIAMRAAFKAVTDGKQVAVLVPTTVLALQHFRSFSERLKDFPCTIDYLSRARTSTEVKKVVAQLSEGKIDILIGTHRLVGKDVKFKDLGLLIIDEEQKFGVAVKEKLKAMKVNVDTLTMTATPIPRTLQFSLLGARDLSIINTPPPNRYPVQTELCQMNEDVIREAIEREMARNGQVFIVNNRIGTIYEVESFVRRIVPQARIAVGHGQMSPEKLEEIILDFIDYEYDVLIATTIIESGIDIPNANTIIINNAQNFGLSDLHQLRGRVGRTNRKAYCYLISPPLSTLTTEARRRLQAIELFADLGSGFQIAMQDLDIRGAGNLLGAEQSGFIADLGYETYQKILEEAVRELKEAEFSDLYAEEIQAKNNSTNYVSESQFESDLELMIPTWYVENVTERMNLYRELDNISSEVQLSQYKLRLKDRFGEIPEDVERLFVALRLRWEAQRLGIERLVLKKGKMILYLVSNFNSVYYKSDIFGTLLQYVTTHIQTTQLKEENNKRSILIKNINTIDRAFEILSSIK